MYAGAVTAGEFVEPGGDRAELFELGEAALPLELHPSSQSRCTSWRQDASTLIGPFLNIPPLPYVDLPRPKITTSHPDGYLWKRDHVETWLAGEAAAWIDDDFTNLDHE